MSAMGMVLGRSGDTHIPHIHLHLLGNKQVETEILKQKGKQNYPF